MVVSFVVVFVVPGDCLRGMDRETWNSLKHECRSGSHGWCAGLFVSVDHDRCALILMSLTVRVSMAEFALSSSLSPTPKTQVSGEMPHAWPDARRGRIRRAETFLRPSVGKMCEFVKLRRVIRCDMVCPEGAPGDGGVKNVDCVVVNGVFDSVAYSKGYG